MQGEVGGVVEELVTELWQKRIYCHSSGGDAAAALSYTIYVQSPQSDNATAFAEFTLSEFFLLYTSISIEISTISAWFCEQARRACPPPRGGQNPYNATAFGLNV